MSDQQQPIQVNPSALPAVAQSLLRYVAAPIGGYLVGRGWITADQVPQVAGVILAVGSAAWGLWKTWSTHKKLVITADAAPAKVANVTK